MMKQVAFALAGLVAFNLQGCGGCTECDLAEMEKCSADAEPSEEDMMKMMTSGDLKKLCGSMDKALKCVECCCDQPGMKEAMEMTIAQADQICESGSVLEVKNPCP